MAALEYATGREAILGGKPSAAFFETALGELELAPARVAVVGDDLEVDVEGVQRAGLQGVAVRTSSATGTSAAAGPTPPSTRSPSCRRGWAWPIHPADQSPPTCLW